MTKMENERRENTSTRSKSGATGKTPLSTNVDVDKLVEALSRSLESMQKDKPKYTPRIPRNYGLSQDFKTWLAQFNHYCKIASIHDSQKRDVLLSRWNNPRIKPSAC